MILVIGHLFDFSLQIKRHLRNKVSRLLFKGGLKTRRIVSDELAMVQWKPMFAPMSIRDKRILKLT